MLVFRVQMSSTHCKLTSSPDCLYLTNITQENYEDHFLSDYQEV